MKVHTLNGEKLEFHGEIELNETCVGRSQWLS